ncbi:MAG: 50S ribosomal protein L11 methyltransferase [Parvularculaceae bacterium]|nr:50S ribosomal protein L11 methyltransferase [Parvularculaceae bacterium]
MPTIKFTWTGARAPLERTAELLTESLFPPSNAVSLMKSDDALPDDAQSWRLDAYFEEAPDMEALRAAAADAGEPSIEELADIDWVAHALEGLGVVDAGRFVLYGSHDEDKVAGAADKIAIRIDANQAFGTGHHPTTAGCLELLSRFAGAAPETVFDLGCGSAVLAIAAAKLWEVEVLASDVDVRSVEIANENIALNGADDLVNAIVADGFADPRIKVRAPYDFIFANILAGPLVEFAPAMADHLKPAGRVMLAGLMADQEAGVVEAYRKCGFKLINRLDHKTWPVLLLVKLHAHA